MLAIRANMPVQVINVSYKCLFFFLKSEYYCDIKPMFAELSKYSEATLQPVEIREVKYCPVGGICFNYLFHDGTGTLCIKHTDIAPRIAEAVFLNRIKAFNLLYIYPLIGYSLETSDGLPANPRNVISVLLHFRQFRDSSYPLYWFSSMCKYDIDFMRQLRNIWTLFMGRIVEMYNLGFIYSNYSSLNIIWDGAQWVLFDCRYATFYKVDGQVKTRSRFVAKMTGRHEQEYFYPESKALDNILIPEVYALATTLMKVVMRRYERRDGYIPDEDVREYAIRHLSSSKPPGSQYDTQYYDSLSDVIELLSEPHYTWVSKLRRMGLL